MPPRVTGALLRRQRLGEDARQGLDLDIVKDDRLLHALLDRTDGLEPDAGVLLRRPKERPLAVDEAQDGRYRARPLMGRASVHARPTKPSSTAT
jgi:hypothetical protein